MKNKLARALAITALVFMAIFVAALTAAIIDKTLLNGAVTYVAVGTGVFTFMIFIALKADGRGFSITKMNNEIEMEKIERERAEREAAEDADADGNKEETAEENAGKDDKEQADEREENEKKKEP